MSIDELSTSAFGAVYDGPEDDRLPPQDVHAERSVLGGMLLSKDAIADVVESLRGVDFYRPAHEIVYDAILALYGRGEPADAITVADELTKRGDLARIGGQAYLHELIQSVPTAANAGFYAEIVAERAVLRRLVEAGTRIVQLGFAKTGGLVEDIVNAAQAEVYAVTDKRGGEDYARVGELVEMTLDEIEVAAGRGGEMTGVPTGFTDLDQLTNGLHPGQMVVLAARPAVGKALALDTPLPTPAGWTTMGAVEVGSFVLGSDGSPTRVVAVTDVLLDRPCYEVHFSDGTVIVADAQHQWLTETRASRRSFQAARDQRNRYRNQRTFAEVRTTEEIRSTLRTSAAEARLNHSVSLCGALDLPECDLPIHPYALGAWLGDGSESGAILTTADPEIVMYLEGLGLLVTCPDCGSPSSGGRRCAGCHAHHGTFQARLRTLGVLGNKHIPPQYLRASVDQRRELLAGLLDTDGTVASSGVVQFTSTSERLADDVRELIVSLGYRCSVMRKNVRGSRPERCTAYTINVTTSDEVFRLPRKQVLHKERCTRTFKRRNSRFITDVRSVPSVPVRCIEVAAADHLYLASSSMIPTHNSTLGLDIARNASIRHGLASVIFSLEMSKTEITMRMLSAEAGIQLQHMRKGTMRDEDWQRISSCMGRISEAPLFIDDSPNMSLMEIRAKCRRLKQKHNLKLVVIDYLQLMSSGRKVESRQQEVSEFSRALKLLAKELEVPVIAISQLNRGPEQRTDKKPQMSDLRESGCLVASTRVLRADTGAEVTLGELYVGGARDVPVWSLDESLRYVRRHLTHVFATGTRPVFELTLASGKRVRSTENHPFLTYDGWTQLGDLRVGSRVAVPQHVPAPEVFEPWDDSRVIRLARLLADGSRLPRAFSASWLRSLGVLDMPASERGVPQRVFHVSKRQIALFVRHVWAASGSVTIASKGRRGRISCAVPSRRLADDLSLLLLRFGISTRVRGVSRAGAADGGGFRLDIAGADSQRRFLQEIGFRGADGAAERLLSLVRSRGGRGAAGSSDGARGSVSGTVDVWDEVRQVMTAPVGVGAPAAGLGREPLGRIAAVLDTAQLDLYAVNDLLWDEVVAIEPNGVEEVFDATVLGGHNFIANGIAVHNSIEQDADVVILLHREELYEKESPRAGEADLIVAKHRNGPTDTITVAFQGHYSRFNNMAANY